MAIAISFGKSMILAIKSFFRIWIVNKSSPSAVHSHTAHYNWCFDVNSELNANVSVYILVSSWLYVFGDMFQWYGNVHPVIKRKTLQLCCNNDNDSFPFWLGSSNTFVTLLFMMKWNGMEWFSYTSYSADLLDMWIDVSVCSFLSTRTLEIWQGYTMCTTNHLKYLFTFVQKKVRPGLQICSLTIV